MRTILTLIVASAAAVAVGCGGGGAAPPTGVTPVAAATPAGPPAPAVYAESPDYLTWSKFPVLTTVVRKKVSTNPKVPDKATVETTTIQLAEKDDLKAVVTMQITVEKPDEPLRVNPPMKLDYKAKFLVPPGLTAAAMQLPDMKATVSGEETLTVQKKEYKCTVYTWTGATESGPMPIKLWVSEQMPGRIVKQEYQLDKAGSKAVEEVIDVKVP